MEQRRQRTWWMYQSSRKIVVKSWIFNGRYNDKKQYFSWKWHGEKNLEQKVVWNWTDKLLLGKFKMYVKRITGQYKLILPVLDFSYVGF